MNPPKEIEVKFQSTQEQLSVLKKWLDANANFEEILNSHDYYLDHPEQSNLFKTSGFIDSSKALRVRINDDKSYVTLKVNHIDQDTNKIKSIDEYETGVKDGQVALRIFYELGYKLRFVIKKVRHVYRFEDFEIVFDDVENLGQFIEVELKSGFDSDFGRTKIFDLLKKIGFDEVKIFDRGYATMFNNPGYDFSRVIKL